VRVRLLWGLVGPHVVIWAVVAAVLATTLRGPGCTAFCAVYHAVEAYVVLDVGAGLSLVVGVIQTLAMWKQGVLQG
jgi:hypothetical protein